jgi:hypothetical protein
MKRLMSYLSVAAVLVLFCVAPAFAADVAPPTNGVPEPGTMAVLGAIAAGGLIARKIIKRK